MCEFVSWVEDQNPENNGRFILFITNTELETVRGQKLARRTESPDDLQGHGFIRGYFGLSNGKGFNREVSTLIDCDGQGHYHISPSIPREIVQAIKHGQMSKVGMPRNSRDFLNEAGYKLFVKRAEALANKWCDEAVQETFWKVFKFKKYRLACWR